MEAIKQPLSGGKKAKSASGPKRTGSKTTTQDNGHNQNKGVGERIMELNPDNPSISDTLNGPSSHCGSSHSTEIDQEVQDITNRAARLDVGHPTSMTAMTNSPVILPKADPSNGLAHFLNAKGNGLLLSTNTNPTAPESPKLMLDEEPLTSPGAHSNSRSSTSASGQTFVANSNSIPTISEGLPVSCDALVFRQQQQQRAPINNDSEGRQKEAHDDCTLLDTKVPLDGQFRLMQQEEVSYYNDQISNSLLEPRAGGSLDHNSRPKLLAASLDPKLGAQTPKAATSCQHLQQQLIQQQQHQQQHQHHHHYHQLQLQQLQQSSEHSTFANQHSRQSSSRDYLNDVDEDYDECDPRYHNAQVEKRTQKQFQDKINSSSSNNNNNNNNNDNNNINAFNDGAQSRASSGAMSTPTSPKAKSAPATPCNITPTAFHQGSSHLNAILNPSPANTLPPDIRKNISATCRVLPSSVGLPCSQQQQQSSLSDVNNHSNSVAASSNDNLINSQYLDELMRRGQLAFNSQKYQEAIEAFSQCIESAKNNLPEKQNLAYLRKNFKLYGERAEAHFQLGNFLEAIEDSRAARELNPKWTHAYYLQGQSQFLMEEYADSLAVFSFGLAQDPSNRRLFDVLVDCALKSPEFKQDFEPEYKKLKSLDMDKRPFVVVSVLGQQLLSKGHGQHAAIILESALKMGPMDNKKFKASVLSTIALAYCLMKDYEKAISYQQKEFELEMELEDVNGQCRVLSNLGYTYYKLRKFDKSLEVHRKQLNLAMRGHLFQLASMALNAIGHVHWARQDYSNALTSHTRCLEILRQVCDYDYGQYKELLAIGHIHSMLNDFKASEERYNEAIVLLQRCKDKLTLDDFHVGLIMVKFNLAYLSLKRQAYHEATQYYDEILDLTQKISHPTRGLVYKMRASNGLGQTMRLWRNFHEARKWFEKQLQLANELNDAVGQSQALCNLGMIWQHFKDFKKAWEYFDRNLKLVEQKGDQLLKAYALSYMASMCFVTGRINEAQTHYENSANLFKELDCPAERKTIELNMAFVQERAGCQLPNSEPVHSSSNHQRKVMLAS